MSHLLHSTPETICLLVLIIHVCCSGRLHALKTIDPTCKVETSDGIVDLSSIAKSDGETPAFQITIGGPIGGAMILWNPCTDITFSASAPCVGELLSVQPASSQCMVGGSKSSGTFAQDTQSGKLTINYLDSQGTSTPVLLACDQSAAAPGTFTEETSGQGFLYSGKAACPSKSTPSNGGHQGLTGGSILLIVVLVLVIVYVVGGVLLLKFVKKKEGTELIPNAGFWKDMPFLVKDGVMFAVKCGKTEGSYDDI